MSVDCVLCAVCCVLWCCVVLCAVRRVPCAVCALIAECLQGGLSQIDYDQLRIENKQFYEKIQDKNKELLKMKVAAGTLTQVRVVYGVVVCDRVYPIFFIMHSFRRLPAFSVCLCLLCTHNA